MGSSINPQPIRQKLVSLIQLISIYLIQLLSFLLSHVLRFFRVRVSLTKNENEEINFFEQEPEKREENQFRGFEDVNEIEEKPDTFLKFKFPVFGEFKRTQKETGNIFNYQVVPSSSGSKYEFLYGKSLVTDFIDEPETLLLSEINESRIDNFSEIGKVRDKGKKIMVWEENEREAEPVQDFIDESKFCSYERNTMVDDDFDSGSTGSEQSDGGFLSDADFGRRFEFEICDENEGIKKSCKFEENKFDFADKDDSYIIEELNESEDNSSQNPNEVNSDFLSEKDFNDDQRINFLTKDNHEETMDVEDDEENPDSSSLTLDGNKMESLWEHQELIEQLKMELRKVRSNGLPTLLEESESHSPEKIDELKPWKIEERFQNEEDYIGELHKFYKSYREKMRKFDILNYQKMYAMGFLALKDPLQEQNPSPPTLKSLISHNLWLFKHKVHGSDPTKKFIKELQGDLEFVYVGHMCLSWEFLHWQYEKALDMSESDRRGNFRYNEVAGEFQQFQVLMQRFIEDEPFQGPRVQNYVRSRCVLRNLLQVPVIRVDNLKDKKKGRNKDKDEYVITSDMLVQIMEESIRIFWQFVRADKDCTIGSINGHKKKKKEVQNFEDLKLLVEIRKSLQKKERKVKDLLRSENCILRKFRQCSEEDDEDQTLHFFSQVDLKLVARVLSMSKITRDQLIWCRNKLERIRFVDRKIYVEPGFLLFPC